jgi:acyl-coenzyme A synthetase/AMP-(fatty) acid ligase
MHRCRSKAQADFWNPQAAYKLPRAVQFVSEVPITASGKIMRRLLKDIDDGTR